MRRRARVPPPAAAPAAATASARPPRRALLKAAASALPRLAADVVLYGMLAVLWVKSVCGTIVEILGRWVFGEGSSVEAAGTAVERACLVAMLVLIPAYVPLVRMRVLERVEFERKEKERREKPASNQASTVALANEELPERNRPQLPKGVKLAPLFALPSLLQLMNLAIIMLLHQEGSLMWRVGSVLFDVARLGIAVIGALFGVPNVFILVTIPRVKDGDNVTHFSLRDAHEQV
ncbi:hypothetical protein ACP70R_000875 [Stipagrostis hirtigluma subsp. patula]